MTTKKTQNRNSEVNEVQALLQLKRVEIRFHIAKLIIITTASVITAIGVFMAVRQDNDRTRNQINCVVDGFLLPGPQIPDAVHSCRK